jgi:hypothetical protein
LDPELVRLSIRKEEEGKEGGEEEGKRRGVTTLTNFP